MNEVTLSAGDPIEARCTKCKKITNHIVVAVADKVPAKVKCNTCGGEHKYRKAADPKKVTTRRSADPKDAERKEWEKLRPGMNSVQAVDYTMTTAFKIGALVNHPVFGLGVVQSIGGSRKIQVLFEDGKKTMRCK